MREILFRGKKVGSDEWIYGNYLHTDCYDLLNDFIGQNNRSIPVRPETVGQYTGLCDKNGTKIFEGDIIKHYNGINPQEFVLSVVKWDCLKSRFYKMNIEDCTNWVMSASCKYEVIGNIYDNPELLKGGEGE